MAGGHPPDGGDRPPPDGGAAAAKFARAPDGSAAGRPYGRPMTTHTITRLGAGAGAAYVLLAIVGSDVLGAGGTPPTDAAPAEFARWLTANHPSGAGWIAPFL